MTIYTDAAAVLASSTPSGVDILLLGADRIASNGATSNKTGTLPAVLSARFVTSRLSSSASLSPSSSSPSASNAGINPENPPDIQQQQHTVKVLVLGDTEKIAPPGRPEEHVVEDNDAGQVISGWKSAGTASQRIKAASEVMERYIIDGGDNVHVTSGRDTTRGESRKSEKNVEKEKDKGGGENLVRVVVRNVSFEWCPPELIDGYITEQGEQTVHDIARRSQQLADKERRIFGNL